MTREIPASEWEPFFSECTQRHQGQPITIEEIGGPFHAVRAEAYQLPLRQISEWKGDAGERIEVTAGSDDREPVCHRIDRPTRVKVFEESNGCVIEIAGNDGRQTRLRFGQCQVNLPPGNVC